MKTQLAMEEVPKEIIEQAALHFGEDSSYAQALRVAETYSSYGITPFFAAFPSRNENKIYVLIRETQDKKKLH